MDNINNKYGGTIINLGICFFSSVVIKTKVTGKVDMLPSGG